VSTGGRLAVSASWTQGLRTASAVVDVSSLNDHRRPAVPSRHVTGGERLRVAVDGRHTPSSLRHRVRSLLTVVARCDTRHSVSVTAVGHLPSWPSDRSAGLLQPVPTYNYAAS